MRATYGVAVAIICLMAGAGSAGELIRPNGDRLPFQETEDVYLVPTGDCSAAGRGSITIFYKGACSEVALNKIDRIEVLTWENRFEYKKGFPVTVRIELANGMKVENGYYARTVTVKRLNELTGEITSQDIQFVMNDSLNIKSVVF